MMRSARDTPSPFGNHTRRIDVSVVSKSTEPTSERFAVPLPWLDMPATRTSRASVGRAYHLSSNALNRCKQEDSFPEESGRVLLPSNQAFRVFKCQTSTRALCHGHSAAGFSSQHLPLRTHLPRLVNAVLLQHGTTVPGAFQNGAQVRTLVAVRACDRRSCANITTDELLSGLLVRQGHLDPNPDVPLAIFSKDLALFTEHGPRIGQGAIDGPVLLRRNVELPDALDHDPQVEALRFAGRLDLGCVNQFGFQEARLMPGLRRPSPVGEGTSVGSPDKVPAPFCRRVSALLAQHGCTFRMKPRKESRQETKGIGLIRSGEQFQLVTESYGMHGKSIAKESPRLKRADEDIKKTKPPEGLLLGARSVRRDDTLSVYTITQTVTSGVSPLPLARVYLVAHHPPIATAEPDIRVIRKEPIPFCTDSEPVVNLYLYLCRPAHRVIPCATS